MHDSTTRVSISRLASVIEDCRKVSAAVLYSYRWLSSGRTPSLSSASRTKTAWAVNPTSPTSPLGWSQISSNAVARW